MKKLPALLVLLYLFAVAPGHAQTDNTLYVKNFPGQTVGQKATAAQAACNANEAIPCIIVFDPTLATYAQGTMPEQCPQCIWQDYRSLGVNSVTAVSLRTKAPRIDITYPDFGLGQPIASITVASGACTSNPSVTVPAPAVSADGSQAVGTASCVNGQTYVSVSFPGGGYLSGQSATISGGGTSGAVATINLLGTAGQADPTGVNDSTAAIENALDYAALSAVGGGVTPQVRVPAGKYLLNEELMVPGGVRVVGDGRNASLLVENNPLAGITVYNYLHSYNEAFETYSGLDNIGIVTSLGHNYLADQLQIFGATGFGTQNVRISGGAGIGIDVQAERGNFSNTEIDEVRQPVILGGIVAANETLWTGTHINGGGQTPDGYYFGANAPGGVYPSTKWGTGATIASAVGNGSTATFVIQCNSACGEGNGVSPIGVGAWFKITGVSDVTGLNGIWQAATITNNSPSAGQFTIVTAPLETGTYTAPQAQEQFSLDASQMPMLLNASSVSVSGTASGLSGATFQPVIWPQQNAAVVMDNATQTAFVRSSIKANWTVACFQAVDPGQVRISDSYCEGFPIDGQPHLNPDVQAGGYLPYTNLTASLSATNCATLAPCLDTVAQSVGWMNEVNNVSQLSLIGGGMMMDITCPDFNPASTSACASLPGVQQNQFEIVRAAFLPNGNVAIVQRDLSGSTAPANTVWPSGSHIGWAGNDYSHGPRPSLDPGLTLVNNHFEDMDGSAGAQWYAYESDNTAMIASTFVTGFTPDNVMTFTPGTAGQYDSHMDTVSINSGFGACSSSGLNLNCPKIEGNGQLNQSDQQQNSQAIGAEINAGSIPSLASNALLLTTLGAAFVYYPSTGALSVGSVSVPSEGIYVEQQCGSLTSINCLSVSSQGTMGSASTTAIFSPSASWESFRQTANQSCQYDVPPAGSTHAQIRWCMDGGPYYGASGNPATAMEEDNWTGTAWNRCLYIPTNGTISGSCLGGFVTSGAANTFTAVNTFSATTDFAGNVCGTSNGGTSCDQFSFSAGSGNGYTYGGMSSSQFDVNGGSTIYYRCTGTTNAGLVASSVTPCGGAPYATAIGFVGN